MVETLSIQITADDIQKASADRAAYEGRPEKHVSQYNPVAQGMARLGKRVAVIESGSHVVLLSGSDSAFAAILPDEYRVFLIAWAKREPAAIPVPVEVTLRPIREVMAELA